MTFEYPDEVVYARAAEAQKARDQLAQIRALADEWDRRADRANDPMAAGAIHGCAAELRERITPAETRENP